MLVKAKREAGKSSTRVSFSRTKFHVEGSHRNQPLLFVAHTNFSSIITSVLQEHIATARIIFYFI